MTAEEKFNARAKELGLDILANGGYGHYGVETPEGVIVLVHEDDYDWYDEYRYPSMEELSMDAELREKMFDVFDSIEDFDDETIGKLYRWKLFGDNSNSAKYPTEAGYSSVYFACKPVDTMRFEDDEKPKKWHVDLNFYLFIDEEVEAIDEEDAIQKALEQAKPRIGHFTDEELEENYFDAMVKDE